MTLTELQQEWRDHATRMRACCKRSAEYRSLGTREEMAAIARDYDGFADQLSPFVSQESAQAAQREALEARIAELEGALKYEVDTCERCEGSGEYRLMGQMVKCQRCAKGRTALQGHKGREG